MQSVSNCSFADVGGLWRCINEKIFVAHKAGANSLTMIDIMAEEDTAWQQFKLRMAELGIVNYHCISADVCDPGLIEKTGQIDVVHCAGVIYHTPNPMLMLQRLAGLAKKTIILSSFIQKYRIRNSAGNYTMPKSGVLFIPALDAQEKKIIRKYWQEIVPFSMKGITHEVEYKINDFESWWWLPTQEAMLAMCEAVGLRVLDYSVYWGDNMITILLGR